MILGGGQQELRNIIVVFPSGGVTPLYPVGAAIQPGGAVGIDQPSVSISMI